jgi:hypothetical protein
VVEGGRKVIETHKLGTKRLKPDQGIGGDRSPDQLKHVTHSLAFLELLREAPVQVALDEQAERLGRL